MRAQPLHHAEGDGDEPQRRLLVPIQQALADFPGFQWQAATPADAAPLLLVHPPELVRAVLSPPARKGSAVAGSAALAATDASVQLASPSPRSAHPSVRVVGAALDALASIKRDGYRIAGTLAGGHHSVGQGGGPADAPFNDLAVAAGTRMHAQGWGAHGAAVV